MWVQSLGQEAPLEEEMATHSSIFAWKIPWTEEPGRLQSPGWQRAGHTHSIMPKAKVIIVDCVEISGLPWWRIPCAAIRVAPHQHN